MARLRLFANLREAAGTAQAEFPGTTVQEVLDAAQAEYGTEFSRGMTIAKVWVNGEPATPENAIPEAVLPGALPDQFDLSSIPLSVPASLLDRRPDIRAAEMQLAASTERIGVSIAAMFLPARHRSGLFRRHREA